MEPVACTPAAGWEKGQVENQVQFLRGRLFVPKPAFDNLDALNGWERTPFHISRNELAVADERRADWCLMRLYHFAREPKPFEHRRALLPLLNDRSEGSVEFKHQNISAVLKGLGEAWIPG